MILSKDFIISNSIKFKKDVFGGVYFLSKNNNIVYVSGGALANSPLRLEVYQMCGKQLDLIKLLG